MSEVPNKEDAELDAAVDEWLITGNRGRLNGLVLTGPADVPPEKLANDVAQLSRVDGVIQPPEGWDLEAYISLVKRAATPSLPASGHGEVAGLVEELRAELEAFNHSVSFYTDQGYFDAAELARAWEGPAQLLKRLAAPTPSPVEARADGVREGLSEERLRWIIRQAVVESGPIGGADSAAKEILAALESTPAQPVREGQEGKAEPVAWRAVVEELVDAMRRYGLDVDTDAPPRHREMMRKAEALLASQPDPAAEIAKLRQAYDGLLTTWAESRERHLAAETRAERAESELAVIREALEEIINYSGGADNALEDPYVMERARAALANTAHRGQEEKGNG